MSAWTGDLAQIPPAQTLVIPEPEEDGDEMPLLVREFSDDSRSTLSVKLPKDKKLLKYKVLIHVDRVEEDEAPDEYVPGLVPPSPISDQDGLPSPPGRDPGSAGRRRTRWLPWQSGVRDKRGPSQHKGKAVQQRTFCQVVTTQQLPQRSWRLSPMPRQKYARRVASPRPAMAPVSPRPEPMATPALAAKASSPVHPVLEEVVDVMVTVVERQTVSPTTLPEQPAVEVETIARVMTVLSQARADLELHGEMSIEQTGSCDSLPASPRPHCDKPEQFFMVSLSEGVDSLGGQRHEAYVEESLSCQDEADSLHQSKAPQEDHVGPNEELQLVKVQQIPDSLPMKEGEAIAMGIMKAFCTRILKALAPPLLREVQATSTLRPEAEAFTPRRSTRGHGGATPVVTSGKQPRRASTAETALLKALGITPADMSVDEHALHDFEQLFDSPLRDQHVHVLASVFGKIMPEWPESMRHQPVEICMRA
jgi:hypothetical protein